MTTACSRWVALVALGSWLMAIGCARPSHLDEAVGLTGGGPSGAPQTPAPPAVPVAGGGGGSGGGAGAMIAVAPDAARPFDASADARALDAELPRLPFECAADRWAANIVDVGEVSLHVACRAEDDRAPLIVLLHGYPELHLAWNRLAPGLIEHGFALLAPDQRGYNLSDKPEPVEAYAIDAIVRDLHGLIEASGRERVVLIGHDWGGLVSFAYAHLHPQRVRGIVIMNGPHPDIWGHPEVDPVQAMASEGYVPLLVGPTGELALPLLDALLAPHLSTQELEQYRTAWQEPGALTSINKWYEANVYPDVKLPTGVTIEVPALALWGMDDAFVTPSQLEHLPSYVFDLEIVRIEGVDHWITHQEPARLLEHIVTFEGRLSKE